MNSVIFKVLLKGTKQDENKSINSKILSFKSILTEDIIKIPSHYISSLKSMSENFENIISFQNLEEVITIGELTRGYSINYYIVILFSMKSEQKRTGFLIANIKKIGDALIGIWPFTEEIDHIDEDYINKQFDDFINNHDNYQNLVIINPN
jgi:hypothetical protein